MRFLSIIIFYGGWLIYLYIYTLWWLNHELSMLAYIMDTRCPLSSMIFKLNLVWHHRFYPSTCAPLVYVSCVNIMLLFYNVTKKSFAIQK